MAISYGGDRSYLLWALGVILETVHCCEMRILVLFMRAIRTSVGRQRNAADDSAPTAVSTLMDGAL